MITKREKLLRSVAGVLARHPGVPYQQLAEMVGVSRRTLYRLAPSREALLELLLQQAEAATFAAMKKARLSDQAPLAALKVLTHEFIKDSELYGFWVSEKWARKQSLSEDEMADPFYDNYRQQMVDFFIRGQAAGVFSSQIPARWMVAAYDALLQSSASLEGERADKTVATETLMHIFLNGTAA